MSRAANHWAHRKLSPVPLGCAVACVPILLFAGAFGGWGNALWLVPFFALLMLTVSAVAGVVRARRWGRAALVCAVGGSLLYGWIALNPFHYWFETVGWGSDRFDSGAWRALSANNVDPAPRGRMLRSLLRDHPLEGMTTAQVRGLLGDGERSPDQLPQTRQDGRERWEYDVGLPPALSVDHNYLVIEFRRGRVVGWDIYEP